MPAIKPSSDLQFHAAQGRCGGASEGMKKGAYWAPSHLQFHRYVAGQATEVGAVLGSNDLEAIGEELNGWRVAVLLRQACLAGLAAGRTPQVFVPLIFHDGRPGETAKTPAFEVRSNSNQAAVKPGRRSKAVATPNSTKSLPVRKRPPIEAAFRHIAGGSMSGASGIGEAARPVRPLAI
jgi:hypothetical protein